MSRISRPISAYYGHGDQPGFVICKDKIYEFMVKNKLMVHSDVLWKYNLNTQVWNILWPKTPDKPINTAEMEKKRAADLVWRHLDHRGQ